MNEHGTLSLPEIISGSKTIINRGPLRDLLAMAQGEAGLQISGNGQPTSTVRGLSGRLYVRWKTVRLGLHRSSKEYRTALADAGFEFDLWGDDVLDQIDVSPEERDVNLVVLSVAELGFTNRTECGEIFSRAMEFGLALCPAEVGPALRLEYFDQPCCRAPSEHIQVAMQPVSGPDGDYVIFCLGRERTGNGWLYSHFGHPSRLWNIDDRFAFTLP